MASAGAINRSGRATEHIPRHPVRISTGKRISSVYQRGDCCSRNVASIVSVSRRAVAPTSVISSATHSAAGRPRFSSPSSGARRCSNAVSPASASPPTSTGSHTAFPQASRKPSVEEENHCAVSSAANSAVIPPD